MSTPINQMSMAKAQETFFYDDSTGDLYWKIKSSKRCPWGTRAGSRGHKSYLNVMVDGVKYQIHNLVWNWHCGLIPEGRTIDHKDKSKTNNRINNLRLANQRQQEINKFNLGICKYANHTTWLARHHTDGKTTSIGRFATALQARLAYEKHTSALEPEYALTYFTDAINKLCAE